MRTVNLQRKQYYEYIVGSPALYQKISKILTACNCVYIG